MIYVSARATVWAVTRITQQLSRGMLLYKGGHKPSILKADPMTMWLGIVLGAMAFAGTAISGSTADYIELLGCFPPPHASDIEPISRDRSDSTLSALLRRLTFDGPAPLSGESRRLTRWS